MVACNGEKPGGFVALEITLLSTVGLELGLDPHAKASLAWGHFRVAVQAVNMFSSPWLDLPAFWVNTVIEVNTNVGFFVGYDETDAIERRLRRIEGAPICLHFYIRGPGVWFGRAGFPAVGLIRNLGPLQLAGFFLSRTSFKRQRTHWGRSINSWRMARVLATIARPCQQGRQELSGPP